MFYLFNFIENKISFDCNSLLNMNFIREIRTAYLSLFIVPLTLLIQKRVMNVLFLKGKESVVSNRQCTSYKYIRNLECLRILTISVTKWEKKFTPFSRTDGQITPRYSKVSLIVLYIKRSKTRTCRRDCIFI